MTQFTAWKEHALAALPTAWRMRLLAAISILAAALVGSLSSGLVATVTSERHLLLVLLPLVAVAGFILSVVWFDGMIILCFALLGLVRIEPAPVDMLSMLLLGLGILSGRLSWSALRGSSMVHAAIWGFVLINLIALPSASDYTYGIRYTIITLYLIGFAYLMKMYITSSRAMAYVMFGYLASCIFSVMLVGLGYSGLAPEGMFVFESRATAFFKDTNVYAPSLVLGAVFLVDEVFRPRFIQGWNWLKIIGIFALAAGVFLSFSRASTAHLILALGLYFLFNMHEVLQPKRLVVLLGLTVVALIGLATIIVQLDLLEFLLWRATPVQPYDVTNRFATQSLGIEAGITNLFGIGPGMLDDAHSLYIRTFAEYGMMGFIALISGLLVLLFAVGRAAIREAQQGGEKPYGLSAQVVFVSFIGMLLNGFVIDLIHWRQFWFLVGLAWVVAAVQQKQPATTLQTGYRYHPGV